MNANDHFNAAVQERDAEISRLREELDGTKADSEKWCSLYREAWEERARLRRIEEAARDARVIGFEPGITKIDSGSWNAIRAALADQPTEEKG